MAERDRAFEAFHDAICLTQTQRDRFDAARRGVSAALVRELGVAEAAIRLQGSYATDTTIRPLEGEEFDLDLVIGDCAFRDESSVAALNRVRDAIETSEVYRGKTELRNPCVRVSYADSDIGKMHVDVVPLKVGAEPPDFSDAPHQLDGWHATAPAAFLQWVGEQPSHYRRILRMLKSWRDEAEGVRESVSSIVLQVLIARNLGSGTDDAERIESTLTAIKAALPPSGPPSVLNPVLPSEDLARNWTPSDYGLFMTMLADASDTATRALNATAWPEAADLWQDVFGARFPLPTREEVGVELGDYSHKSAAGTKGWRVLSDPAVQVAVSATRATRVGGRRRPLTTRDTVAAGQHLWFKAHVSAPARYRVWWRVTNTGDHARHEEALRGGIIPARNSEGGLGPDDVHHEATAYTGVHLVEALVVVDQTVVAQSEPFEVAIYSSGWDPRRRTPTYRHHGMS